MGSDPLFYSVNGLFQLAYMAYMEVFVGTFLWYLEVLST